MDDFSARDGAALVVGATGGIGRAVCRLLAQRGSCVVVGYRSAEAAASSLVEELRGYGVGASAVAVDLADDSACRAAVSQALATYAGLHTLVHAAGPHVPMTHLSRVPADVMAQQLEIDAGGFFRMVSAALPALRDQRGSIVAVTTAATTRFPSRDGLSSAPKAAVEALVRALAVEEGRYGVRVNAVGPGMLTDGMAERLITSGELDDDALEITRRNIPLARFGRAHDIAEAVCFLASDRAGFVSGQKLDVDGGYGA